MTEHIITCPKCSKKLRVQRKSDAAIQFNCAACGQTLKLAAKTSTAAAEPQASTQEIVAAQPVSPPATPVVAAPVQAPPSPAPNLFEGVPTTSATPDPLAVAAPSHSSSWQAPRTRKQVNLKPLRNVLMAFMILSSLGGVGFLAYKFLPAGTLASMNPLSDSPESVLAGMRDLLNSATSEMASIRDTDSRARAIERLKLLQDDAHDLQRRAVMIQPMSEEKHQELKERFESEFEPIRDRLRSAIKQIEARKLASRELTAASLSFSFSISDLGNAISAGWRELPAPENDEQKLEYEKALVLRELWRATIATVTESDYRELPDKLSALPDRLRALKSLQTKVAKADLESTRYSPAGIPMNMGQFDDIYRPYLFDMKFQTAERMERLEREFGVNAELKRVAKEIQAAQAELSGITHELAAQEVHQRHEEGLDRGPRGPGPSFYRRGPDTPAGIPEYDLGAPPDSSDRIERVMQNFVRASGGPKNLVIIRFSNLPEDLRLGSVAQNFVRSSLVDIPPLISRDGAQAAMAVRFKGTVSDLVNLIEIGSIAEVDSERRVIFVDAAH